MDRSLRMAIDGFPVEARWGTNVYELPAGHHAVQVWTEIFGSARGAADTVVPVSVGRQTPLYYRAPVTYGLAAVTKEPGVLDSTPRGYPGAGPFLAVIGVLLVVIVGMIVAIVVLIRG